VAFSALPAKLNGVLAETAAAARERFSGPVTYASAPWEPVDWQPFDIVAIDSYRDATNAGGYRDELRRYLGHGKPLAVTEFGSCCYAGAADRGGLGWAIIDESADPPRLDGDYPRDEAEQARYLPGPRLAAQAGVRRPGQAGASGLLGVTPVVG
jgi:hypothetical protein